ncbi:AAA family ATPase [Cellulomonas sp. NPDC057328]|uniref:ATP-binding protein n=1 Tax=Cellulomonas sp. NPDC057328 TaxID=3346101 RepID=UPI003627B924
MTSQPPAPDGTGRDGAGTPGAGTPGTATGTPATAAIGTSVTGTSVTSTADGGADVPVLRPHAEDAFADELAALAAADDHPRPPGWRLSPWAVTTYLVGGTLPDGTTVSAKYLGSRRLMEIAVASLATDRALLLLGVPGTAKTWVGEHLAAAVSGDSTLVVQGTAGTPEEQLRYGWNYARLLADGPTAEAVVPSPVMRAMRDGALVRIEELTRIPADVQDALISILSEKMLPVPELRTEVQARPGFNVIATANDRDKGVNDLSSALRRRFNTVVLPLPDTLEQEVEIVRTRVAAVGRSLELPPELAALAQIERVVTVFRELRGGVTLDRRTTVKSPSATLSTAEAISVVTNGTALAAHFGDGVLRAEDVAASLTGAVVKDPVQDRLVWQEYLETVVRDRAGWEDLYRACRELV